MSATACIYCGRDNDRASSMTDGSPIGSSQPADGDVSVCIRCGCLSTFTGIGVEVRPCTPAELDEFLQDPTVRELQVLIRGALS